MLTFFFGSLRAGNERSMDAFHYPSSYIPGRMGSIFPIHTKHAGGFLHFGGWYKDCPYNPREALIENPHVF